MSKTTENIGLRFENFLLELFPELMDTRGNSNTPDFYHPELNFWIEAKVGNYDWGTRIKEYQVQNFQHLQNPVAYAFGFHNFSNAHQRLKNLKTQRGIQNRLKKEMNILEMHFITKNLVKKIWEKEFRISEKKEERYGFVKRSMVNNLILDRNFKRSGKKVGSAQKFYEFDRENYKIRESSNKSIDRYSLFLDNEKDKPIIDYLGKKGF